MDICIRFSVIYTYAFIGFLWEQKLLLLWHVRSKTYNLAHYNTFMPDLYSNNDNNNRYEYSYLLLGSIVIYFQIKHLLI